MLVNNAAVAIRKPSDELTADEIQCVLDVNVRGVLLLTVAVLPTMLAAGSGSIVSLSSISGVRGTPRRAVYAASKAAIDGMTQGAGDGVRPARHPRQRRRPRRRADGAVGRAPRQARRQRRRAGRRFPTRRLTEADEIADVVTFLASDASRAITGETISADGGMRATLNLYPTV